MLSPPTTLLPLFLLLLLPHPRCDAAEPLTDYCSINRKASPAAKTNIARVLSSLQSKAPSKGFATASYGGGNADRAYGLAQCRPDVSLVDCSACLKEAPARLNKRCRGKAEAWVWFDHCFLRYDTRAFLGKVDTDYGAYNLTEDYVTTDPAEQQRLDRELGALIDRIRAQAASRPRLGLGKGQTKFTPDVTIYALAQCTRDLPSQACSECISFAFKYFPDICPHRKGCQALYRSCYVRYETRPFFSP